MPETLKPEITYLVILQRIGHGNKNKRKKMSSQCWESLVQKNTTDGVNQWPTQPETNERSLICECKQSI